MPKKYSPEVREQARKLRDKGYGPVLIAKKMGISEPTITAWLRGARDTSGKAWRERTEIANLPRPRNKDELSPEALRAMDDFRYFRQRYFGRISTPWQEEAAYKAVELIASPTKEFVVVNCPPGSGKSTMLHDLCAWVTVRNRAIRGLYGSRTNRQAVQYTRRLKRSFERKTPVKADEELKARGYAIDAVATLVEDYGRFQPEIADVWRENEFVVMQNDGEQISEKEPTWSAFGMDSGSLGYRVNFVVWDDLVDKSTTRTMEAIESQQSWWDDEAETRLEPDGCLWLVGQRLNANDLYRYCLDKKAGAIDDDEQTNNKKYHHIVYKAHDESRCRNEHSAASPFWPESCLLDPIRLPWRELAGHIANRNDKFRVLYQQEDVDPASVLVPQIWIDGGRATDGIDYPGCKDRDRDICELPKGLFGELISVATADPSPTKFWSIQWWIFHPASDQRFLMDLIRQSMDAPDFLDYNLNEGAFSGVMDSWQTRSEELGVPITHWVVERNAAQRFLLQYDHVHRWQAKKSVDIIPHDTYRNKSDPDFGIQSLAPHYRYGRVRLPYQSSAKKNGFSAGYMSSQKLIDEVTRWPEAITDDCVMAQWFFEWNLPSIYVPTTPEALRSWVPSWMKEAS